MTHSTEIKASFSAFSIPCRGKQNRSARRPTWDFDAAFHDSILHLAVISAILCIGAFNVFIVTLARGESTEVDAADRDSMKHIGTVHDRVRAAQTREQPSLDGEITDLYSQYVKAKDRFQKATNLQYSLDVSNMYQWGSPDAGPPAGQLLLYPSVNWDFPKKNPIGSGSLQFAYSLTWYMTRQNASEVQGNLNLITPINDYSSNVPAFNQLTFTSVLPDEWLSIVFRQFPVANFDMNQ